MKNGRGECGEGVAKEDIVVCLVCGGLQMAQVVAVVIEELKDRYRDRKANMPLQSGDRD